MLLGRYS